MKSERRHELERNQLAQWLARTIEAVRPYQNAILAVVLLSAVVFLAASWFSRNAAGKTAEGWDEFYQALSQPVPDPSEFRDIANSAKYKGTDVARWSAVVAADLFLAKGCDELFFDKTGASQELNDAVDLYKTVLAEARDSILRERATFGLARATEAMAGIQGKGADLSEAIAYYKEVSEKWPNGTFAPKAAQRTAELEKNSMQAFYEKFAQYKPKPPSVSPSGTPGELQIPFDPKSLPEEGPLYQPKLPDFQQKGSSESPAKPATQGEKPGAGSEPAPGAATGEKPKPEAPESQPADGANTRPSDANAPHPEAVKPSPGKPSADGPDAAAPASPAIGTESNAAAPTAAEKPAAEPAAKEEAKPDAAGDSPAEPATEPPPKP